MLAEKIVSVAGVPTRVLRSGSSSAALVFIHGGVPGVSLYCSGAHIWGECLERFAAERDVVVLDLPGSGGTALPVGGLTIDATAAHVRASLDALGILRCHLIGHDLGGLLALGLASEAPQLVRAVSAVSSVAAAPSGDMVETFTLAYPPQPLWSRHSQAWALERVSYTQHHVDETLLDACVEAAGKGPHKDAQARIAQGAHAESFVPGLVQAKSRFYEVCRQQGIAVPVQVIWGSHDPLGTTDQGLWLYRLVAARQAASHFHLLNRTGALPFREDPQGFHQVVSAFYDVVFPA